MNSVRAADPPGRQPGCCNRWPQWSEVSEPGHTGTDRKLCVMRRSRQRWAVIIIRVSITGL